MSSASLVFMQGELPPPPLREGGSSVFWEGGPPREGDSSVFWEGEPPPPPREEGSSVFLGLPPRDEGSCIFPLDYDFDDDAPPSPPPPPPESEIAQFFAEQAQIRSWTARGGRVPTTNPFLLRALVSPNKSNPWDSRIGQRLQSAEQLSASLENTYMNQRSLLNSRLFRPQSTDTIVCGCFRSGQTPVLQILCALRNKDPVQKPDLLEQVEWIEGSKYHASTLPTENRILKSHLPIRAVFGGEVLSNKAIPKKNKFKVIVMLRNPMDIRLSWFRHVRRVYKKFNDVAAFDAEHTSEDFAQIRMYATDASQTSLFEHERDYEDFVFETMQDYAKNPERILLCFYEELLVNPFAFVKKVAEFARDGDSTEELDWDLIDRIALSLTEDEDFPGGFFSSTHRLRGSSGKARRQFSAKAHLHQRDAWRNVQARFASPYASYEDLLFEHSTIVQRPVRSPTGSGLSPTSLGISNNNVGGAKRSTILLETGSRLAGAIRKRTTLLMRKHSSNGENTSAQFATANRDDELDVSLSPSPMDTPLTSPKHGNTTLENDLELALPPPPSSTPQELGTRQSILALYGKDKEAMPRRSMLFRKSTHGKDKEAMPRRSMLFRKSMHGFTALAAAATVQTKMDEDEENEEEETVFNRKNRRATEAFKPPRADPDDTDSED